MPIVGQAKICPICHTRNSSFQRRCSACKTELTASARVAGGDAPNADPGVAGTAGAVAVGTVILPAAATEQALAMRKRVKLVRPDGGATPPRGGGGSGAERPIRRTPMALLATVAWAVLVTAAWGRGGQGVACRQGWRRPCPCRQRTCAR